MVIFTFILFATVFNIAVDSGKASNTQEVSNRFTLSENSEVHYTVSTSSEKSHYTTLRVTLPVFQWDWHDNIQNYN